MSVPFAAFSLASVTSRMAFKPCVSRMPRASCLLLIIIFRLWKIGRQKLVASAVKRILRVRKMNHRVHCRRRPRDGLHHGGSTQTRGECIRRGQRGFDIGDATSETVQNIFVDRLSISKTSLNVESDLQ